MTPPVAFIAGAAVAILASAAVAQLVQDPSDDKPVLVHKEGTELRCHSNATSAEDGGDDGGMEWFYENDAGMERMLPRHWVEVEDDGTSVLSLKEDEEFEQGVYKCRLVLFD